MLILLGSPPPSLPPFSSSSAPTAGPRRANVLVAFNNFSAKQSVPLLEELRELGQSVAGMDLSGKVRREGGRGIVRGRWCVRCGSGRGGWEGV
jgi:hypothetical protein